LPTLDRWCDPRTPTMVAPAYPFHPHIRDQPMLAKAGISIVDRLTVAPATCFREAR